MQLNAPARLAEATGIDVVADFRSRDLAAGGQGAPLVPAFHAAVFAAAAPRAVVNIGGISNVTFLRGDADAPIGFDCGPGNVLLDLHAARHLAQPFDRDGAFALTGRIDQTLLERLLAEPYLDATPPKSTGRELFSQAWLDTMLQGSSDQFRRRAAHADRVHRTRDRRRDRTLVRFGARPRRLRRRRAQCRADGSACKMQSLRAPVVTSDALGIRARPGRGARVRLARATLRPTRTGTVPEVTGARGARVLGAIYPR